MYILAKLEPRAETTDTLLYYCAKNRNTLEEFLLSLWEEILDDEWVYRQCPLLENFNHNSYIKRMKEYIDTFHIIHIPYMED